MSEHAHQAPNARSPLFQRRQNQSRNQRPISTAPNHYQHQNHIQFISSSPLPNPRQLFPDTSRSKRAFHPVNGAASNTTTPYGAINSSPMRVNTSGANAMAHQNGFSSPGPGTPKQKQVPLRTTKVSQKLVLLPEDQEEEDDDEDQPIHYADQELDPFRDEIIEVRGRRRGLHGRAPTHSELLTKEQRNAKGLARVVAYCTADGYDNKRLAAYLKSNHGVHPRLYDEALYAAYHFPLIPGKTSRYMSAPPVRSPGGGSILDKQLERYEDNTGAEYSRSLERESDGERFRSSTSGRDLTDEELHQHLQDREDAVASGRGSIGRNSNGSKKLKNRRRTGSRASSRQRGQEDEPVLTMSGHDSEATHVDDMNGAGQDHQDYFQMGQAHDVEQVVPNEMMDDEQQDAIHHADTLLVPIQHTVPAPFMGGEVFFFDYGVTVFWNFTVEQEAWILTDLAQFEVKRLIPDDVQTEEFHFEYAGYSSPRIYNDMITLRGGNHMIKLTISHAISQSVKLALYECQMDDTIDDTKIIPIRLAQTGKLNYSRPQITRISGHLFQLRMNVDLVSNVLDSPEIFWSEPELQPLYDAIRGYLEIGQRAKVLSDRCLVISDLLTMLRDDLASNNMNYITWIIIILIVIAVVVAAVRKSGGASVGGGGGRGGSRGGGRGGRGNGRGGRGRGGSRSSDSGRIINPAPKKDTGRKDRATTSLAGKRKQRGDSSDEDIGGGGRSSRKSKKNAETDSGDDEIGAGGIDDMDLEFGGSDDDDEEDEALMNETAAQKRLRLAKNYIDTLQHAGEEEIGYDAEDIDRDNIADRLKQDALEIQGRLHRHLTETFQFPIDVSSALTTCRGHQQSVTSIAATENGLYAFSGSKDGSIIKWDLKTGKKLFVFPGGRKSVDNFKGHTDHVICLAVSSDNQFLASGGKDKKINVWSVADNKFLHCFKQQHKDTITGMSFRKGSNNQLYTVSSDRTVKLWNVDELSYIETLFGHQDSITAVDSLAKEHCVSTGGRDRTVRLWKIVEESQLVFRGGGFIRPKKLNKEMPDEEQEPVMMVPTPGPDGGVIMVEKARKKPPTFLEGSMDCLAMIDEENFLTGGDSGTISLWNINKKKAVFSMPLAHGFHSQPLDYSNGEDTPSGGVETPYWITSLASLRYSDMFVSGSWDGTIRVWQIGKNMKNFSLVSTIPMIGVVNDLQLYQPIMSKRTIIVAGVGQEHKLGRWLRIKEARNGLRIVEVSSKSKQVEEAEEESS
ncbi:pre-rRNA processing protein [Podila humilis]|nr:pre-rRNA processing protein [Podila humilis]